MSDKEHISKIRLDKWLWFTRVAKTRNLCSKHIQEGHIFVNGAKVTKPSKMVEINDVITITISEKQRILRILALGEKRASATLASQLYEDITPHIEKTQTENIHMNIPIAIREKGQGRPTKKERRLTDHLRNM